MRKSLLLCVLIFNIQAAHFQTIETKKAIDSLHFILQKTKSDSIKISLYNGICERYYPYNKTQMIHFNNKIWNLSKKTHCKRGLGFYYSNRADIDFMEGNFKKAISDAQKAVVVFSENKDSKEYLTSILDLASACIDNQEYEKSRTILENINLPTNYKDDRTIGRMYMFLGMSYTAENATKESLTYFKKALFHLNRCNEKVAKQTLYQGMYFVYKKLMQYEESLKYINLLLNSKLDEYTNRFMLIEKEGILNNLKQYSLAKIIALENEKLFLKRNDKSNYAYSINKLNLMQSYFGLKQYQKAIANGFIVTNLKIDSQTKATALDIISTSYLKLKKNKEAKIYIDKSLTLVDSISLLSKSKVYLDKSKVEEALGNYEVSLFYNKEYSRLSKEYYTKINEDKIQQLQVNFDVTAKENKIKKLEITGLQKTINLEKQRSYLILFSFIQGIALVSIFAFVRVNNAIKKRNEIIEESNIELSKASLLTQKSLAEKELLLKEIHHRVKIIFN